MAKLSSTYRLDRSFEWNFQNGPSYDGAFPAVPETPLTDYFGVPVRSRIGIAASVLVNQRWLETYARLGFDLLTYKTVRIRARRCHSFPNWYFVDDEKGVDGKEDETPMVRLARRSGDPLHLTGAGSFGMPSRLPDFWQGDIRRCRAGLAPGKALIVSIVGTPQPGMTTDELIDEFGTLAEMVSAAGAHIVEANLSCPNVGAGEGELYRDPEMVGRVARSVRNGVGDLPVTLKLGHIPDDETLTAVLRAADGSANGVVTINGVNRPVVDRDGSATYGPGRETCGIIGAGILPVAVDTVARAVRIVARDGLSLKVVGTGGVTGPKDAAQLFDAGAYAVFSASGAIFDPHLAVRIKQAQAVS